MAAIQRFEDIEAWKEARKLTKTVYDITKEGAWQKDFGLRDQIRRASVSILANIAEGFGRETDSEFARFLAMARGSAAEVKAHLYVALDQDYLDDTSFAGIYQAADRVARLLTGFMQYLRKT